MVSRGVALVVDDDEGITAMWRRIMRDSGVELHTLNDPLAAAALFDAHPVDVAVFDIQMPGKSGLELLAEVKAAHPATEVIMQTGFGTVQTAVEAMKAGAYDFLTKPFEDLDQVRRVVLRALDRKKLADRNRQLEAQVDCRAEYEGMVGSGAAMRAVFETVETVAYSQSSVLVTGESGTGKELVARALHYRSPRKDGPFVPVNCAAITETLLESELFGHVKGAFTGAAGSRRGLFEAADRGTIFLDEVGEIPPSVQVKLLRVLQEGELRPVGSSAAVPVDVRVVAATNRDLAAATAAGTFRDDLYYRLNVITIALPPLRDRRDDVAVLAHHFLRRYAEKMKRDVRAIEDGALAALASYGWPGNIRELENAMERAVVLCRGDTVAAADLPPQIATAVRLRAAPPAAGGVAGPYREAKAAAIHRFEQAYFTALFDQAGGRVGEAARLAGLDRSNFRRLLDRHPGVRERAGAKAGDED